MSCLVLIYYIQDSDLVKSNKALSKQSFSPYIKVESVMQAATLLHWDTESSTPHQPIITETSL